MSVTFAELKTYARQRADMEGSNFVTETELGAFVNGSAQELYDILVSSFQDYYISQMPQFTLSTGEDSVSLPADFYKLRGVDKLIGGSTTVWTTVDAFSFAERNSRQNLGGMVGFNTNDSGIRYRVQGSQVKFTPADDCAGTYRLWYVPRMPILTLDSDSFDGVNGWEEYIIVDAAIKCLQKEESSSAAFERQKAALIKRIEDASKSRDAGSPEVIVPQGTRVNWWGVY